MTVEVLISFDFAVHDFPGHEESNVTLLTIEDPPDAATGDEWMGLCAAGLCFCFCSCFIFSHPLRSDRGRLSRLLFFPLFLFFYLFFGCSDGMEREACVCDHGFERSDLCAEII